MSQESLFISERMEEVSRMCERENPIYEQISSFSIALYVTGVIKCPDLLSFEDIDSQEAARYLKENYTEIRPDELPVDYHIRKADETYLLVIGDPSHPVHFAVFTESGSPKPYFSKLTFFGSGFDSLDELKKEFLGKEGIGEEDIHYFKQAIEPARSGLTMGKLYFIEKGGGYAAFKEENGYLVRENRHYY